MTPNRSTSYRGSEVGAISIAQHMMPNTNGQVELRFAQLKNSPTKPAFSLSRTAPPGPRFIGASMFCSTHWTKSFDRRPTMFACSARWIIRSGPRATARKSLSDKQGHDTDVMDIERALVSRADDQLDPDDLHPADTTLNLGLDARCIMTARRSYSIARQDTGLNGFGSTGTR